MSLIKKKLLKLLKLFIPRMLQLWWIGVRGYQYHLYHIKKFLSSIQMIFKKKQQKHDTRDSAFIVIFRN